MPGRHRQFVPPRVLPKRLVAAGASGVVTVLALAPLAHAETADDVATSAAPSSDTPTSSAPTSDVPSSEAPSSEVPSSDAPSSEASSTEAPSSAAPSSTAPSSPPSSAPAASSSAPAAKKQGRTTLAVNYGSRKIYVDAQLDENDYYPANTTTVGSVFTIVETGPSVPGGSKSTPCTTEAPDTGGLPIPPAPEGSSSCFGYLSGYKPATDSTVTITQKSPGPDGNTVIDPQVFTSVPCVSSADPTAPAVPLCSSQSSALFTDGGLPPVVSKASQTVTSEDGAPVTISPDSQIDRQGAPATSVDVDQPAHGTVRVNQAAAPAAVTSTPVTRPFTLTYTPAKGYAGPDSFRYRVTTANGTSDYVTVSLRVVGAAPTARNDEDTTTEGEAVRVAVLRNDDTNGGGAVRVTDVGVPKHGSARISGRTVVYTPSAGFTGTEKFSYTISSYSGSDTATVTVRVAAVENNDTNSDTEVTADTGVPSEALLEIGGALLVVGAGAAFVGRHRRRERA